MLRKDFMKRFGIETNIDETKKRFINRVDSAIFDWVIANSTIWCPKFLRWLGEELGESWHKKIVYDRYSERMKIEYGLSMLDICQNDFLRCIQLLELVNKYLLEEYEYSNKAELVECLNKKINDVFQKSEVNVGVFWREGKFLPSGAEELDEKLVVETLKWLNRFPDEKKDFEKALKAYIEKRYNDVVSECYLCIEGIVKKLLGNDKGLGNNKEELLKRLNLSKEWKYIINGFYNYANEFKRHATKGRHDENPDEVEAFIYLTGLIANLCIKQIA